MTNEQLVSKVWNYAHVLRDQGISFRAAADSALVEPGTLAIDLCTGRAGAGFW